MTETSVLVVDPDATGRAETARTLREGLSDVTVDEAGSFEEATTRLEEGPVDAVVTESDIGDGTGLELAERVRTVAPDAGCLLYTDAAEVDTASAEQVVTEYLRKGTPDAAALLVALVEQVGQEHTQAPYPLPDDEDERLAAIERFVDARTDLRDPLGRVLELATTHFEVEEASVNVVREHTQDFLVSHRRDWATSDRTDSICTYTILEDAGVMAVEDTREDPRFADNEFLQSADIRAYLGANIESPDGHVVATLCVYDDRPRTFSTADRAFLGTLADLVGDMLALSGGGDR